MPAAPNDVTVHIDAARLPCSARVSPCLLCTFVKTGQWPLLMTGNGRERYGTARATATRVAALTGSEPSRRRGARGHHVAPCRRHVCAHGFLAASPLTSLTTRAPPSVISLRIWTFRICLPVPSKFHYLHNNPRKVVQRIYRPKAISVSFATLQGEKKKRNATAKLC